MPDVFKKQVFMIASNDMIVSKLGAIFTFAPTSRLLYSHRYLSSKSCNNVFGLQKAKALTVLVAQYESTHKILKV